MAIPDLIFIWKQKKTKMWLEVKGVTLETEGVAMFPDAPSLRALKHVEELITAWENGYEAGILLWYRWKDPVFHSQQAGSARLAQALERAEAAGVGLCLWLPCDQGQYANQL